MPHKFHLYLIVTNVEHKNDKSVYQNISHAVIRSHAALSNELGLFVRERFLARDETNFKVRAFTIVEEHFENLSR